MNRAETNDENAAGGNAVDGTPCLILADDADDLEHVLRGAAALVLKHPAVMQDVFVALVAEGRRFAATSEGRRWQAALAGSELVRHGRALWEASALNLLEDAPGAVLPSAVLDAIVRAISRPDLLARLPRMLHG